MIYFVIFLAFLACFIVLESGWGLTLSGVLRAVVQAGLVTLLVRLFLFFLHG